MMASSHEEQAGHACRSASQVYGCASVNHINSSHLQNKRFPVSSHHQRPHFSQTKEFSFSHKHKLRFAVLALTVALLVTHASASVLPERDPAKRTTYPAQSVRDMVQKIFREQKESLWRRSQDEQAEKDWTEALGQLGRRVRRDVGQEEVEGKVLSMEQEDRLGTLIGEVMSCQNIPGLSLGVVRRGVRQALGYGVADMDTGRPVDSDTLFGIGSNTKAFAAATLAHLMTTLPAEKRFAWTTKLKDILEDFRLPDDMRTEQTTLLDVLSHRTGLGSADLGLFAGYPLNMTTEDLCSRLRFLPEVATFRSGWHYSNTLYVIASRVCETAAGKDWAELARETIWQPLGMNDTDLTPEAMSRDNMALPYILRMRVDDMFVQQDPRLFNIHPLEAAGAIMSSATDMTRWMRYLLDVLNRPASSAERTVAQLFTERTLLPETFRHWSSKTAPKSILNVGYGMGFMTSYYQGHKVHWHTGDLHGYASHVLLVPGWDSAVYIATNGPSLSGAGNTLMHLAYFVLDLMHDRTPWVNVTLICQEIAKPSAITSDDEYYDDEYYYSYEGDYPNDYYHKDEDQVEDANHIGNYNNKDYHGDDSQASPQTLLLPIDHYTGVYGHGLLGDMAIVREEERNSLLRMELGRFLVADLIPTDNEAVFRVVARAPVADTKEWEVEHVLRFGHSGSNTPKIHSKPDNSQPAENGQASSSNNSSTEDSKPLSDVPFDIVQTMWNLEVYTFSRHVRFATALDEGKTEPGTDEDSTENSGVVSGPAAAVGSEGHSGAGKHPRCDVVRFALVFSVVIAMFQ